MKIIALTAENVKKLTAVEIRPDGNVVQITGKNGQGKTSVLDSIWWAIAGATHIQAVPIRKGATEARIRLDLGEIIVTRTFSEKKDGQVESRLTVETEAGARFPSPQKMLDALLGELAFDPLAFTRIKPREQFDMLRRFVPDVDFAAYDADHAEDYALRRDLNRQASQLRAQEAGILIPADAPTERADTAALVAELERAGRTNAEIERTRANHAQKRERIEALEDQANASRAAAASLRRQAQEEENRAAAFEAEAATLRNHIETVGEPPAPVDTAPIRARLTEAERANSAFEAAQHRRNELARVKAEAEALEAESATLTKRMEARNEAKEAAIAAAELPVPGLGFGDGVVTMNGVPFEQASDAEQLRVSIAIAMKMNPKLRVIRVRDGSLLDEDALALIGEMADAEDYQVWIEAVRNDDKVGIVIEAGAVKSTPGTRSAGAAA